MRVAFICLAVTVLTTIACAQGANGNLRREIAITFDDLPASYGDNDLKRLTYVTRQLLMKIKSNNVPAIGFVNERKLHRHGELNERTALLRMWLDAGLELGNHTFSHIAIDEVPLEAYKEDVTRGETVIKKLLSEKGMKLQYFRHTQLRTGPTLEYKLQILEVSRRAWLYGCSRHHR